jgi:hypothetical protein
LLLHHLAELLELGVVSEPLEVPEALLLSSGRGSGISACACTSTSSTARTGAATLLGGQIEQIHVPVIVTTGGGGSGSGSGSRGSLAGGGSGLLEMLGDALDR